MFCFLLVSIFLTFMFIIPYYCICKKETEEKGKIEQLKDAQIYEKLQESLDNHIKYYKYNQSEWNVEDVSKYGTESHNNTSTQKKNQVPADSQSKWIGDCVLVIPDIDLEKIVYTGKNREQHLENYELITASENMKYTNGGNYIICGHASRLYGHSLNRLKEVKKGTKIQIWTRDKMEEYIVNQVTYQNMNQTSQYCNQTQSNTLTIISCAKYVSKESYIVIHAKRK